MKNKRILISAGIIIGSGILAIVNYFILPDTVVLQISLSGGAGNTVPKIIGLLIPFSLSVVFSILYYTSKNKKYLMVSLLGIVLSLLLILVNCAQFGK